MSYRPNQMTLLRGALAGTVACTVLTTLAYTLLCTGLAYATPASQTEPAPQRAGDLRSRAQYLLDCQKGLTPDTCVSPIQPRPCPPGQQWSLAGGIAHCVALDPVCPPGTLLIHDRLGNPVCQPVTPPLPPEPPTLPPEPPQPPQPPEPVCVPSRILVGTLTCPPGFDGRRDNYQTIGCDASGHALPASYALEDHCTPVAAPQCVASSVLRSSTPCAPWQSGGPLQVIERVSCPGSVHSTQTIGECVNPVVTCTPGVFTDNDQACPAGYSGTTHTTTSITCPSGPYGYPVYSQSEPDLSLCNALPACPNGARNYPVCTVDGSGNCANGAHNPPACDDNRIDCPALPGPFGEPGNWPNWCQGWGGVPPGRLYERYYRIICGTGASGCHCSGAYFICREGGWAQ